MDPDKVIDNKNEDLLNRNELAISLANTILNYELSNPLTIGIYGSWGSGKSSLLKLTENILEKEDVLIIRFEPWFFSTQDNLYLQFFKLLISKLKDRENNKVSLFESKITPHRRIFEKPNSPLQDYFNYIKNPSNKLNNDDLFYSLNNTHLETYGSLIYHKKQCEKYFENISSKIIVIIDDIDRLTNNEISQIFNLVKSLANFKHFIYILSFDKEIVSKSLNDVNLDDHDKFIDKIIQIPISMPKISESKMDELILKDIGKIYDDKLTELALNNYSNNFEEIFYHLKLFIKDIRDLKRYKNTLNFYLDSFLEELNINDFFLILAIHLFEHDLYLKIKNNENSLIVKKEFTNKSKNFQIETSTDVFENIFKNKKWNYLKETLIFLFPILNSEQQQISYETYINWEKNHKLCSEKYFENYFTLSLENYEITITSLNQLIKFNEVDEIYNYCTKETNLSYNHSLLRGFKNLIPEIPLENHEFFIKGLMKAGDSIKIHHYSRKYFNWIFNDLFEGIKSKNECYRILKECIEYYENNILTLSEYIYSIAFDYGLTRENENIKTENDMIISKSQTNHLIKLIINKIHKSSANKEFLNQKFLKDMLIFWERLEDKQTVKKYILENVKTTNEILSFLNKFKTIQEDGIEEYPKSKLVFDLESLTKYHSLKFYEEIINNKLSNEDLNKNDRKYFETFIIQSQEFKQKKRSLFITYCSNIKETYRVLEKWINGSDINWENSYEIFDSDIPHSDIKFEQTIDNAIKNSSVFIILLGMCNSQKEMGWINKELKIAQKYNKPILAIKYGENEIPTNIKETADKIVNWEKSDIINRINEILGIN